MLRPVDMALTIQHANETMRPGDAHSGRPEVAQKAFADRLEKEIREQEKQTRQVGQSEKNEVNPDRKGDGTGYYRQGGRRPAKKTGAKPAAPEKMREFEGESMYDIRV